MVHLSAFARLGSAHLRGPGRMAIARPEFVSGRDSYQCEDMDFIFDALCKETGAAHLDLSLIEPRRLAGQLRDKTCVVLNGIEAGEHTAGPDAKVATFFERIRRLATVDPDRVPRIVFPLIFMSNEKGGHAAAGAIEWDRAAGRFSIGIFEQHAITDGSRWDYSNEIKEAGEALKALLAAPGLKPAAVCTNTEPYSRHGHICTLSASETVKTLARSDRPLAELARDVSPLRMDRAALQAAHGRNRALVERFLAQGSAAGR